MHLEVYSSLSVCLSVCPRVIWEKVES